MIIIDKESFLNSIKIKKKYLIKDGDAHLYAD